MKLEHDQPGVPEHSVRHTSQSEDSWLPLDLDHEMHALEASQVPMLIQAVAHYRAHNRAI